MSVRLPDGRLVSQDEADDVFMLLLEDDEEDSPWMVMGSLQWEATNEFYASLHYYAEHSGMPWLVAGMMPILYDWPDFSRKRQLAPDVFVAFAPNRPRPSFDSTIEGFPPFILEVVSPSSADRDNYDKKTAYAQLGAREYALFTPQAEPPLNLTGYRRNDQGRFAPWPTDDRGQLWSNVLGLYLVSQGTILRAATPDGHLLPTLREETAARERETAAREREVAAREREVAARREVEAENERLRQEIALLRRQAAIKPNDL